MRAAVVLTAIFLLTACASIAAPPPVHLNGEVLVQHNGPRTVLAFVNAGRGADMQMLRITAERAFAHEPISMRFERAQVTLEADRTTILDPAGKRIVVFALHEAAVPAAPEGFEQIVLRGYWLGRRSMNAPGLSIAALKRDRDVVAQFCDATYAWFDCQDDGGGGFGGGAGGGSGASCDSGGRGATSCSCSSGSGSCSVSCGGGTYPCCRDCDTNAPTCVCVAG